MSYKKFWQLKSSATGWVFFLPSNEAPISAPTSAKPAKVPHPGRYWNPKGLAFEPYLPVKVLNSYSILSLGCSNILLVILLISFMILNPNMVTSRSTPNFFWFQTVFLSTLIFVAISSTFWLGKVFETNGSWSSSPQFTNKACLAWSNVINFLLKTNSRIFHNELTKFGIPVYCGQNSL